jgi:DNA-directed RNA polymerase subunit H (RpoH/RPB5)
MDTLRAIRNNEYVKEATGDVMSPSDMAYVKVELQQRGDDILVFMKHSDNMVNVVLREMDREDSGYVFFASELDIDPLNNNMVPKHRIATNSEIDELIGRRVPLDKLPILRMLDPVRRWHNFPRGSVVVIERPTGPGSGATGYSATGDVDPYFRRVV